jgi:hypothetical protein
VLLQVAGGGGLVGAAVAGEAKSHVDGVVVVLEVGGGVGDVLALAAGVLHPAVDGDVVAAEGAHGRGPVLALVTRVLHLAKQTIQNYKNKLIVFLSSRRYPVFRTHLVWLSCIRSRYLVKKPLFCVYLLKILFRPILKYFNCIGTGIRQFELFY